MRSHKWRMARRQNRVSMQPVINLPPPTIIVQQPPVMPVPKPTPASRILSVAKVAVPVIVSVAALVISLLTYTDQHEVDQTAAAATLRHNAAQVSGALASGVKSCRTHSSGGVVSGRVCRLVSSASCVAITRLISASTLSSCDWILRSRGLISAATSWRR